LLPEKASQTTFPPPSVSQASGCGLGWECDCSAIDQRLRHEPIGPKSLDLHPFNPGMFPAAAIHSGGHLLFYVTAEEKVRLHDDTSDRNTVPVAVACSNSASRIHNRFIERWPCRGHETQFDA
jgi:hypothetical protein